MYAKSISPSAKREIQTDLTVENIVLTDESVKIN